MDSALGNDFKTFWWHMTSDDLPAGVTNAKVISLDYAKIPELFEAMNSGFQPVSHSVLDRPDGVLLSILLVRPIELPDSAETITDVPD